MQELLGYKLMLAFAGTEVPGRIAKWIEKRPLGGFTLFRHANVQNPAQVRALTTALQSLAAAAGRPSLLIATDQEGGQLNAVGNGTTQFAGNMALGATRDPDLARQVAAAMGQELAAMGVNVNYAPDCDLCTAPENPAGGVRTFSDDPALAAEMAVAMTAGFQSAGVAATVKHFPGSGAAVVDSHHQMPLIDLDRAQMEARELVPFRAAVAAGVKMVMSGHFATPALTGAPDLPATLSRAAMHDLLRREMGFNGVTVTDALDMKALTQGTGQIVDVIAALRADVDLLLTAVQPDVQERIYGGLQLAASRRLLTSAHVEPSVRRIRALQDWVSQQPRPDLDVVGCAAHQRLAQALAERSLTLVRNDAGLLPLRPGPEQRIAVILPQPKDLTPADTSSFVTHTLAQALRAHHAHVDEFVISHLPDETEIAALCARAADYDLLIVGTINAGVQPAQAALADALLDLDVPAVMVALRTPYDLRAYPQAATYVCTYSILPPSMTALARALFGEIGFAGKLPVKLPEITR